ncbi:MAG: hypothetical protein Roseis2KO_40790 [Roseivirga sp.]
MKKLQVAVLIFISIWANAQDGSDIIYVEAKNIDSSLIGKMIHIDFFNESFGSNKFPRTIADTITIDFIEEQNFKEIRNDDHYNNWFSQQWLEAINEKNGLRLRIQKMKLLNISNDSITVKLFGHYFKDEQEVFSEYLTQTTRFNRRDINHILVDANPPIRKGLSVYRAYHTYPNFSENSKPDCYYCFSPNEDNLFDYPILSDYHIEKFDYENQRVVLTELGQIIVKNIEIPLQGLPVIMTLNGEIIYGFWLWHEISSFGCDRVYTYPRINFKMKFGLPHNNTFGDDPRFDQRLKEYSKLKNK